MAKRFRFTLQKVLELREWEEKQAELVLAAKTGQCAATERQIEELLIRRRDAFLSRGAGGLDLNALTFHERFRMRLGKEIEENEKRLARLTLEREEFLATYLAARRRRDVLSKLSEKRLIEFRKDEDRREAVILDDLNTAVFIRKMRPLEVPFGQV